MWYGETIFYSNGKTGVKLLMIHTSDVCEIRFQCTWIAYSLTKCRNRILRANMQPSKSIFAIISHIVDDEIMFCRSRMGAHSVYCYIVLVVVCLHTPGQGMRFRDIFILFTMNINNFFFSFTLRKKLNWAKRISIQRRPIKWIE